MNEKQRVDVEELDGARLLVAAGEFDVGCLYVLRDPLRDAVQQVGRVVLDLSAAVYIDSTVLGALVGSARQASANDGWLRLVDPHPYVRKVLKLTGIDSVIGIYDNVAEALEDPGGEAPD